MAGNDSSGERPDTRSKQTEMVGHLKRQGYSTERAEKVAREAAIRHDRREREKR